MIIVTLILIAASYLVGSIPVGVMVGRMKGVDPREVGSGNIGMANVARAAGRQAAALTFAGDLLKGAIPVLAARTIGVDTTIVALAGFAAFLGSIGSIFLGFKGGRGVSTSLGVWLGLAPAAIAIAFAVFLIMLAITRIISLGSISAAIALPPTVAALGYRRPFILLAIVMAALVLMRHHENIGRLMRGEEPAFTPANRR